MRNFLKASLFFLFFIFLLVSTSSAGLRYQDFETQLNLYGWGVNGADVLRVSGGGGFPVQGDRWSWQVSFSGNWGGTGIPSQVNTWHFDLNPVKNDRFIFYIYALPQNGTDNNVGVQFFDHGNYNSAGFEVWTTQTAFYGRWTELHILYSQLPPDFNRADVDKVQFINYCPGTYYFDDIGSFRRDRVYQSFEPEQRAGSTAAEYGWKWNDDDTVDFSSAGEPVLEGAHSWKLMTPFNWSGTGIQSQEKRYLKTDAGVEQAFWHVDLEPGLNDRLTLWVYALPENGMDNNLAVQFYDNGKHFTDDTNDIVWAGQAARYGAWTRMTVPLSAVSADFDLRDINKLQCQYYWPGTYFIDDIRAGVSPPVFDKTALAQGHLQWQRVPDADYSLQESSAGPEGPWQTAWASIDHAFWQPDIPVQKLTGTWYRMQWIEGLADDSNLAYYSDWSDAVEYNPPVILIDSARLKEGVLEWANIDFAGGYEVESAPARSGPWSSEYSGTYPQNGLNAQPGIWYRVRAVNGTEKSAWSAAQEYDPGRGFIRAQGTVLREDDGSGEEIVLRGVNLGNYLLNEKWMTGIGAGDTPNIEDEWTLRNELTARFGAQGCAELLNTFRDSYLQEIDFDNLLRLGVNFVRLPVYYRILQDEQGNWVTKPDGEIDFDRIDRVVRSCAERGIYVLLDLHGAPGAQSTEFHTGRADYNQLFKDSCRGASYRDQTVALWKEIACHYKDDPAVLGYDLLNEPMGAPTPQILWDFYDRIYRAIREVDANHLMVMEGIWFWDTLPNPRAMDWENVAYQFHYYLWGKDDDIQAHREYIDGLVAESEVKQAEYQVPVMIGEFTGFGQRAIWEYYLANFNRRNWSWSFWSYKTHDPHSNWALYTHTGYDAELPKIRAQQEDGSPGDSFEVLKDKFSRYGTVDRHEVNFSLAQILAKFLPRIENRPFIKNITPDIGLPGFDFVITGENFGCTQGSGGVVFSGDTDLPVISWSDTSIHAYVPADEKRIFGFVTIRTGHGVSNIMPVHIVRNMPPVLTPVGNRSVSEGQVLSFTVTATDKENDLLTYTASSLPQGASFVKQVFNWVPGYAQAGTYQVTFTVTDGHRSDREDITIAVADVPLTIGSVKDSPDPFSPNKDSRKDITAISGSFNRTALWTLKIKNSAKLIVRSFQGKGAQVNKIWDGKNTSGVFVRNGTYAYTVSGADAGGSTASRSGTVTVDRTAPVLSKLKDSPDPFWPRRYPTNISFKLSEPCYVTIRVYSGSKPIRTLIVNSLFPAGTNSVPWNGKKDSGVYVSRGVYTYHIWVEDSASNRASAYPLKGKVTSY
ncbi:MAG: cellulase family glycosylhydrolase [Candidatus Omnitrophota bacterium]